MEFFRRIERCTIAEDRRRDVLVGCSLKREIKRPSWLIFNFHSRISDMRTSHGENRVCTFAVQTRSDGRASQTFPDTLLREIVRHRSWLVRHSNEILTRDRAHNSHPHTSLNLLSSLQFAREFCFNPARRSDAPFFSRCEFISFDLLFIFVTAVRAALFCRPLLGYFLLFHARWWYRISGKITRPRISNGVFNTTSRLNATSELSDLLRGVMIVRLIL